MSLRARSSFVSALALSLLGLNLLPSSTNAAQAAPPALLRPNAKSAGVSAIRVGDEVVFATCDKVCGAEDPSARLTLPEEVRGAPLKSQIWRLRAGDEVLEVKFPSGKRTYSVLVRAARRTAEGALGAPQVLLRGFTGGDSGVTVSWLTEGASQELIVARRKAGALCGREGLVDVRRYDPSRGEFVAARLGPVDAKERARAPERKPSALTTAPTETRGALLEVLPSLHEGGTEKSRGLVDGDEGSQAREPWGTLVLDLPEGTRALALTGPGNTAAGRLWLLAGDKLSYVSWPAGATQLQLPLSAAERGCVALINDAAPVALTEVHALVDYAADSDTAQLIAALAEPERAALAERGLLARGEEAARALSRAYPRLPEAAQKRALALAPAFARDSGLGIEVAAYLSSTGARRTSLAERIGARGARVVPAIVEALELAAPADELVLLKLLESADPAAAARAASARLEQKSAARRQALRDFLTRLARDHALEPTFRSLLSESGTSRRVSIELLRALAPLLDTYKPEALPLLEQLLRSQDFTELYLLLEPTLRLVASEPRVSARLLELMKTPPAAWSSAEKESWLERALVGLAEQEPVPTPTAETLALAQKALSHSSMRVRRAAAETLAKHGGSALEADLEALSEDDAWPAVREGAVRALAELVGRGGNAEQLERAVGRALSDDPSLVVRRAAARALREFKTESSLTRLREALDDDPASAVRAEAATALGRRCDQGSLEELEALALRLDQPMDEAQVDVSMAALTALAELAPPDLEERIRPLRAESLPGQLRGQIDRAVERAALRSCTKKK